MEKEEYKELWALIDTNDHDKLRTALIEAESKIKELLGKDPINFYVRTLPDKETAEKVDDLLSIRKCSLNAMFKKTAEETERFSKVNDLLLDLTNQMYRRTCNLYRTVLTNKDKDFDDDYNIDGALRVGCEYDPEDKDYGTVLHFDNDDYYGSDFSYMIYVVEEHEELMHGNFGKNIEDCLISHFDSNNSNMSDEELGCVNDAEDGNSWEDGNRTFPEIIVCHAMHSLTSHHLYSIPDALRINSYWVDVSIDCQRITDQRGRRWADIDAESENRFITNPTPGLIDEIEPLFVKNDMQIRLDQNDVRTILYKATNALVIKGTGKTVADTLKSIEAKASELISDHSFYTGTRYMLSFVSSKDIAIPNDVIEEFSKKIDVDCEIKWGWTYDDKELQGNTVAVSVLACNLKQR